MLILTREMGESLVIDGGISVTVTHIQGGRVRLGIDAPPNVGIYRKELYRKMQKDIATQAKEKVV